MNDSKAESHQQQKLCPGGKPLKLTASCSRCREKKLKCNRALPCDQCTLRGFTDCRKDIRQPRVLGKRRRSLHSGSDDGKDPITALRRRLTELEKMVDSGPQPLQLHSAFTASIAGSSPRPAAAPVLSGAETSARLIEDVIHRGYGIDHETSTGGKVCRAKLFEKPNTYWHTSYTHPSHLARDKERAQLEEEVRKAITELDVKSRKHLVTVIVYRRADHQSGRALLIPVQYQKMERFCETGAYDDEHGVKDVNELALMCLLLSKALQVFPGDISLVPQSKVLISWWRSGEKMLQLHTLAKRLLALDKTHRPTSLAGLQALFHLINMSLETAEELAVYESALQRSAQIIGIHRLGSLPGLGQLDGCTKQEAQKLEIATRLWWGIIVRDWFSAQATRSYTIHPTHFTTRLPLNLNDTDLVALPFPALKSKKEWTDMTLASQTYKMADIVRANIDRLNSQDSSGGSEFPIMNKATRTSVATAWDQYLKELPLFYQLESAAKQKRLEEEVMNGLASAYLEAAISTQRYCLHQAVFDQLLKLHRHEMGTDRVDPSTLMYAHLVLDFQGRVSNICRVVDSWWMNVQHVISACIVIILDLWVDTQDSSQRSSGTSRRMMRTNIRQAISKLDQRDDRVKRAVRLVEALLDAEEERSKAPHGQTAGIRPYDELVSVVRSTMLAQSTGGGLARVRHDSAATPTSSMFDGSSGLTFGSSSASSGASPTTFNTGAYQDSLPIPPQVQVMPSLVWPDSTFMDVNEDFLRLDPMQTLLWDSGLPTHQGQPKFDGHQLPSYLPNSVEHHNALSAVTSSSSGMMQPPPPAPAPNLNTNVNLGPTPDQTQEALWAWLFNSGGVNSMV